MTCNERMKALLSELLDGNLTESQIIDHVEGELVRLAMERSRNSVTVAARILGLHRNTLQYRLAASGWPLLIKKRDGATKRAVPNGWRQRS